MRAPADTPQRCLLRTEGRDRTEPRADAPDRREEPFAPLAGRTQDRHMAAKGQGVPGQQEARREAVPADGPVGHGPEPEHLEARQGRTAQDIQVSFKEP